MDEKINNSKEKRDYLKGIWDKNEDNTHEKTD